MNYTLQRQAVLARRRRRFRYRRLHALRLDVVAVVFLFVAGWLLCPRFESEEIAGAVDTPMTSAIIEQSGAQADALVLSPTVFAFTSPVGFADGVVAAGLAASVDKPALLPPQPEQVESKIWPESQRQYRWPGGPALWQLAMPAVPVDQKVNRTDTTGKSSVGVKTWVSDSAVEVPENFAADLKSGRGKTVRIYIMFGADGRAEDLVLGQNTLDSADAAALERRAMRLKGKPDLFAWITVAIP